jgi:hypothetical protein
MQYQAARVRYFYSKFEKLRAGIYPVFGGNVEFELFTFFEVAYHLKDYIKHSQNYINMTDVEDYINSTGSLRICADICNKLKHNRLHKNRSNKPLGPFLITTEVTVGPRDEDAEVKLVAAHIETEIGTVCCFELAKMILADWESYFSTNKIKIILNQ